MAKTTGALSGEPADAIFCHQRGVLLLAIRGGDYNLREVQGQPLAVAGTPSWGPSGKNTGAEGSQGQIPDPRGKWAADHGVDVLD